jgi:putative DNA primase/helicase
MAAAQASLTSAALALAASGLPVFPCNARRKPIVEGGFKSATRNPDVIREMFARGGAALIGMPTGRASGHVVIDVDPRHGGDAWLRENQNRLPPTLTHGTPRGGEHLTFRDPPEVEIRNSQGRIAPGVDVRGTGGYVVVPPSKGYTIKHNGPLADMPQWLLTACLKPERPPPPPPGPRRPPLDHDGTPYGLKALTEECIAIHRASFGQQEITLNNAALKIGSLAAAGELSERDALAELIAAGNAMPSESGREPWRASEIEKKVRRAFADGKRTPRQVPHPSRSQHPPIFGDNQDQPQQQRDAGDAAEPPPAGEKTYSHTWRSKDHDFPCTPTGVEWRNDADGRIYARVRTPDGEHIVPKDELVPAQGGNGTAGSEDDEPPPAGDAAVLEEPRQPDGRPGATKTDGQGRSQQDGQEAEASPGPSAQQRRAPRILPPPSAPVAVARCFVESRCRHNGEADALTVRYWCGSWWMWRTTHWTEATPHTMRSLLYEFTADAVYFDAEGKLKPWSPNRYKIGDLLEALSALVILPDDFEQPCWIGGRQTGPIVATTNGLLDVASLQLYPHTPLYFGHVSVPFPYDPDAPTPTKWLAFLEELWPDEPDGIDVLGEWFGYVISGRLDLHKIFLMIGPTRGGKGVIARILTALIGKRNVCGPTLSSLGGEFGLAPLLGKSLAVISDARSGGGKNSSSSVVVERLLSISGEDTLTVNRKYRDQWSGKLPVRLHVISNELPRLGDASSAIVGRLVLLLTTRSWLGKENYGLETRLRTELTGILNWSLEGLRRLTLDNENHFTRFAAADEAITAMQDLASPVGAFVRERCKLRADDEIAVDDLYAAYKQWCELSEYQKSPKAHFGRDLRAACPSVRKRRPRDGSKRYFVYGGIRLRKDEEELPL